MHSPLRTAALPLALLAAAALAGPARPEADRLAVPREVTALVGTYTGAWTLYGVDGSGMPVRKATWTDTMTAAGPQVKDGRAFVTTVDEIAFADGGRLRVEGLEGFFLKPDGGLGEPFIETFGQVYRMVQLAEGVSSYAVPAAPEELSRLGLPGSAAGHHVLVKVVSREDAAEVHRITRVTTARWKDAEGRDQGTQFVSLQGHHRRRR